MVMAIFEPLGRLAAMPRPLRNIGQRAALALLSLLLVALAWGSVAVPGIADDSAEPTTAANNDDSIGDFALYALIHQRVDAGDNYYAAAMEEQRAHNYPTRPFVTVRLPTLAAANAAIGPGLLKQVELLLVLAVAGVLFVRLRQALGMGQAGAAAVLTMLGGAGVMAEQAPHIHELAAGLLLSLALVLYRPDRLWPSLLAAGLALTFRELAVPFVVLWLAFAAIERRWREVWALAALLALFAGGLALHAQGVAAYATAADQPSPGWQGLEGPALPLFALARMSGLTLLPLWLAGPLAILPLIGWIGMGGRTGWFVALWSAGFFAAMALFARVENFYWVMMVLPLYLAGFAMVPRALGDVLAAATGRASKGI